MALLRFSSPTCSSGEPLSLRSPHPPDGPGWAGSIGFPIRPKSALPLSQPAADIQVHVHADALADADETISHDIMRRPTTCPAAKVEMVSATARPLGDGMTKTDSIGKRTA